MTTNRNGVSSPTVTAINILSSLQNLSPSGVLVWATAYASTDMESTTTEGASVAEGLPEEVNGIGNSLGNKESQVAYRAIRVRVS